LIHAKAWEPGAECLEVLDLASAIQDVQQQVGNLSGGFRKRPSPWASGPVEEPDVAAAWMNRPTILRCQCIEWLQDQLERL